MNTLDMLFTAISGLLVLRGVVRGLLVEAATLCGAISGVYLANHYYLSLVPFVQSFLSNLEWAGIVAYIVIFMTILVMSTLLAILIKKMLTIIFAGWLDHIAGGLLGAIIAILICAVVLMLVQRFLPQSFLLHDSLLSPYIQRVTT